MKIDVLTGNNLDVLRGFADNCIDSVVTDPPYGLGSEPDAMAMLTDWITTGHHEVRGKGFMGKEWDAFVPQPVFWREVYRVLKPGGHMLVFAGTRTMDLMTLGLRIAGFEIRDSIGWAHEDSYGAPVMSWCYGSGFPKSLNISKAIDKRGGNPTLIQDVSSALKKARTSRGISITQADKMFCDGSTLYSWYEGRPAGTQLPTSGYMMKIASEWPELEKYVELTMEAEREVVGKYESDMGGLAGERLGTDGGNITIPSTPAAKQWDGWGTALKPAWEPIIIARKPLDGTVAANVLKYGTGGINVDGCRVEWDKKGLEGDTNRRKSPRTDITGASFHASTGGENAGKYIGEIASPSGRFPANVITDGSDAVVGEFPDQKSGAMTKSYEYKNNGNSMGKPSGETRQIHEANSGSAARFFYAAKASPSERNAGCEGLDKKKRDDSRKEGNPGGDNQRNRGVNQVHNTHPTVKPISLIRYLTRLITPPGGTCLDPFAGSGTTGIACEQEGFNAILIEREQEYIPIINARVSHAQANNVQPTTTPDSQLSLF